MRQGIGGFFWGTIVPMSVFIALGIGIFVLAAGVALTEVPGATMARVAGIGAGLALVLILAIQGYVVDTRIRRPLARLEAELEGEADWSPERDVLLGSLRGTVERVREAAREARQDLAEEREQTLECKRRLEERQEADRLLETASILLAPAAGLDAFSTAACRLALEVWPQAEVLLLERRESEPHLVLLASGRGPVAEPERGGAAGNGTAGAGDAAGGGEGARAEAAAGPAPAEGETALGEAASGAGAQAPGSGRRYMKASLPVPLKEAMQSGLFVATGLPFSHDQVYPRARSFVALGLEHRGAVSGVLYVISSEADPPSPAALLKAHAYISLAYSRAHFTGEAHEAEIRDSLTGAFTQSHFLSVLRAEIARGNRYGHRLSCAFIDIDDLRRINDKHGLNAGDSLIAETAHQIQEQIRSSDVVARVSGGTFAVVLPETAPEVAKLALERIRLCIQDHTYLVQRKEVERVTVSVGIASHPPHGVTALTLADAAREAMAAAKREGKNRVFLADSETPLPVAS